jgi:hypothetical protein
MSALRDYLQTQDVLKKSAGGGVQDETEVAEKGSSASLPSQQRGLSLLDAGEFPLPLTKLFEQSGLELPEFTESLEALKSANLVRVTKANDETVVELTESGQTLQAT